MSDKRRDWDLDDTIYLIQFVMFYITFVAGIVLLVLILIKKVDFPILGAFMIYALVVLLQLGFMVLTSKPMPDEPRLKAPKSDIPEHELSVDEEMQKEIDEIKELKARLKKESEQESLFANEE